MYRYSYCLCFFLIEIQFSLNRKKFGIKFNKNGTVTYRERHTYVFDRHKSVGPDSDKFTTISIPLIVSGASVIVCMHVLRKVMILMIYNK